MSWAKKKEEDLSLPMPGQTCETCGEDGHLLCWDTDLDIQWAGPFFELHDEVIRAVGEWAA